MNRLLPLLLLLLWSSWAQAGSTLRLLADRPVIIVVNMVPHTVGDAAPVHIDFEKHKAGTQRVTVRNLAGQQMYAGTLLVPDNQLVVVAWRNKQLEVIDRKQLDPTAARTGERKKAVAGHTQLDELAASDQPTDLLDVVTSDASVPAQEGAGDDTVTPTSAAETPNQAPAATGPALRLVPTSSSWANVWIAGNRAWEYRGDVPHHDLDLPPGTHTIEVRDFTDKDVWLRGQITLVLGQPAELHFAKNAPVQARGATWQSEE